jgi:hypothetical protein
MPFSSRTWFNQRTNTASCAESREVAAEAAVSIGFEAATTFAAAAAAFAAGTATLLLPLEFNKLSGRRIVDAIVKQYVLVGRSQQYKEEGREFESIKNWRSFFTQISNSDDRGKNSNLNLSDAVWPSARKP